MPYRKVSALDNIGSLVTQLSVMSLLYISPARLGHLGYSQTAPRMSTLQKAYNFPHDVSGRVWQTMLSEQSCKAMPLR